MSTHLESNDFREVTHDLFSDAVRLDAVTCLRVFHKVLGGFQAMSSALGGVPVTWYERHGLAIRVVGGTIERVWVTREVTEAMIQQWRAAVERDLTRCGHRHFDRVVLCAGPIAARWELPTVGLTLSPMPQSAPRPWGSVGEHPAILRMHYEACEDVHVNATLANRAAEWWTLVLGATTPIGCDQSVRGRQAWAWDRMGGSNSKWLELSYFATELTDPALLDRTREQAPAGTFVGDVEYYLRARASTDAGLALPESLDETLAGAASLSPGNKDVLRRAARWIQAGDRAGRESVSLNYLAIICGIEALAKDWARGTPKKKPTAAFQDVLADLLPKFEQSKAVARALYQIRSALVHQGWVFPDDWIDTPMDTERPDLTAFVRVIWACRLLVTNWIRVRAGLKCIGCDEAPPTG